MRDNYPQSLNFLLKVNNLDSSALQAIKKHGHALIKLNNIIINLLPIEVKDFCRVANYRQDILILEIKNASRKIRLNYELPTLLSRLRNTILPSLSSIKIIINPSLLSENSKNLLLIKNITINSSNGIISKLSKESAKIIYNLANKSPKKLKEKLDRLAALAEDNVKLTRNKD
ncbi:MAG: DUF721 domain-containing protein [Arsenophonus sp.]